MRHRFAAALFAASCALFLLGCGGDSDAGATASAPGAVAPPGGAEGAPPATSEPPTEGSSQPGAEGAEGSSPGEPPAGIGQYPSSSDPSMYQNAGSSNAPPPGYGGNYPGASGGAGGYPGAQPGREGDLAPPVAEGGESTAGANAPGGYPGANPYPGGYPGANPGTLGQSPGAEGGVTEGGAPGATEAPPKPLTLDGLARVAFDQGRERDALQYLYGWSLAADAGAAELLSKYQWAPGLRRPALAVRWGVALQVTAPPNFSGDAAPIGQEQALGGGRGSRREQQGGQGAPPPGGPGFPGAGGEYTGGGDALSNNEVVRFAGEFGQKFITEFQTRVTNGSFGKVLSEPVGAAPADAAVPGGEGNPGFSSSAPPGYGASGASFGANYPGQAGREGAAAGQSASAEAEQRITPGLTFLGTGNEKELLERAKKNGIDVLAVFRVKLTINKVGFIINDTELALFDALKGGKPLYETDTLTNTKVQQARMQNKDDGVEREVKQLFEYIDKDLALTKLPEKLTAENVKARRVDVLVKTKYENPLPVLAEIRFYHRNKLLSDADAATAIAQIIASEADAKTLLEGKEEDRKKAIEKWLPKG